ncbi:MAG TPA: tetratricopeptide repeat protein [Thermoleophilia bacterium]|nr:tetratricopeptide repeat protein [Thermoleophilia bacterium]
MCLAAIVCFDGCDKDQKTAQTPARTKTVDVGSDNGPTAAEAAEVAARHDEQVAAGGQPTDGQLEQYADACYTSGVTLARRGRYADAERYFREVLRVWPNHGRAVLRLGDIYSQRRQFQAAAEAYYHAGQIEPSLNGTVKERRQGLCDYVLGIADQRLNDSRIAATKEVLDFVLTYLSDVGGDEARTRLGRVQPLLQAEAALNGARQDIQQFRKEAAYKKLRDVAASYPRTYFAQEANRLLEENGQKIVLGETATGFKLPAHWRRTKTEHFIVYYERQSGVQGTTRYAEQSYERIVRDFGMDDAEWKTQVTIYMFGDDESWREFLASNRDRTIEWAGGFALPWANEIYLYVTDDKSDLYKGVLPHELTHVLHDRYVGGIYQPIWLKEGLAVSQQKGGVKESRRAIDDLVKREKAFALEALFGLDNYPSHGIHVFYAQSATVVGFMLDTWGVDKLKQFMFAYARTHDTRRVIESVYGVSLDTFEKKWEKYVR